MTLIALGLNHLTAPLDLRGRFAMPGEALPGCIQGLRRHLAGLAPATAPATASAAMAPTMTSAAAPEAAILSTCNRTELYLAAPADAPLPALALDWLAAHAGCRSSELQGHTYALKDAAAVRHAFRVASGLDSQILGEPMILGQLKQAVRAAGSAGGLGCTLHQLFQRSFSVAKQVRTRTEIGAHSVSLAAASVRLAQQLFEDLGECRVLCVGAGEMIERVATHFNGRRPRALVLANRTASRGEALAARLQATAMPLAELPARLHEFDIVISCTASTLPLIGLGAVERSLKARRRRPMLLLDLAVPRDIEPEVARLPDAYLYSLDDLARSVQCAGAQRQAAVAQAEALVDDGVRSFGHWLDQRDSVPLIRSLQGRAEHWQAEELGRARRRLARGESPEAVLESLARGLTRKLLHGPLAALHGTAGEPASHEALARLFLRPQ